MFTQPGLVVTVVQPERPCTRRPAAPRSAACQPTALAAYLNIQVTLTKVPWFKLGGALGATYKPDAPWSPVAAAVGGGGGGGTAQPVAGLFL